MSALTLKGPYWVTVRQHRRVLWAIPAVVAASLAAVVALRAGAQAPYSDPSALLPPDRGYDLLRLCLQSAGGALLFLPLLVGAFVAGPMTARELESGTWRLALSQSTTARAWLGAKVLVAAVVCGLGSAALVGIYRLGWARVYGTYQLHWADRGPYEAGGPVLVAYCLLGVAVGVLVGQLVRRTLAAMAVTGLLVGLVLVALGALRWSFLPVQTVITPFPRGSVAAGQPGSALLMDAGLVTATGERLPQYACFERTGHMGDCPADMHVIGRYAEFHPVSHYWPTQLVEISLVLALAAGLLFAAFRLVRTRRV
ncbi:ABC transporter permease subunit [Streptomyces sp. NPDC051582]|uniref:ABC transporter permease subunit n=1 Tax=Streptomyces sp. NPDC051582 TaxID=3155167 RepID=UPI003446B72F